MHAYARKLGGDGGYDCDSCGWCDGQPLEISDMLVYYAEAGTAVSELAVKDGFRCRDCERWCFHDDEEPFFTLADPDDIVWVCGRCNDWYDKEEDAVSCCK